MLEFRDVAVLTAPGKTPPYSPDSTPRERPLQALAFPVFSLENETGVDGVEGGWTPSPNLARGEATRRQGSNSHRPEASECHATMLPE